MLHPSNQRNFSRFVVWASPVLFLINGLMNQWGWAVFWVILGGLHLYISSKAGKQK